MNILIIYCHPNPKSFNHAIRELCEQALKGWGHEIKVRDLYALGFDPTLSGQDLADIQTGKIPEPIKAEQDYVDWADTLILIYPIWWTGMPAVMKGYIDRVFSLGFAYCFEDGMPKGLLNEKKALIINTTGSPFEHYHESGMHEGIKRTSDEGIYEFCAIGMIDHLFYGAVPVISDNDRQGYLDDIAENMKKYFS